MTHMFSNKNKLFESHIYKNSMFPTCFHHFSYIFESSLVIARRCTGPEFDQIVEVPEIIQKVLQKVLKPKSPKLSSPIEPKRHPNSWWHNPGAFPNCRDNCISHFEVNSASNEETNRAAHKRNRTAARWLCASSTQNRGSNAGGIGGK